MKETSVFCEMVSGTAEAFTVASNRLCVAFLDAVPLNPGHTLVVPRAHVPDLHGLDEQTSADMFNLARQVADILQASALPCDGINLLMSNGVVAEQSVFHAHLHVVPRTEDDGFGFVEPPARRPGAAELETIAALLRRDP